MTGYTLRIFGASDDLIEIEGDLREEFNLPLEDKVYLAVSDGTILSVEYNNQGIWRIAPVVAGTAKYEKTFEAVSGDDDRYSDEVQLTSVEPFTFVAMASRVAVKKSDGTQRLPSC